MKESKLASLRQSSIFQTFFFILRSRYFQIADIRSKQLFKGGVEIIKSIEIYDIEDKSYSLNKNDIELELSKLNIFVGSNNSGKSRLIRAILKKRKYKDSGKIGELIDSATAFSDENNREKFPFGDAERTLEYNFSKIEKELGSSLLVEKIKEVDSLYHKEAKKRLNEIEEQFSIKPNKGYIPTLRGLRSFKSGGNTYKKRTIEDYFIQPDEAEVIFNGAKEIDNIEIFTGLELYDELQEMFLGEVEEKNKVRNFEEFLSEVFFEGKIISLMAPKGDDVVHIKIGSEQDFPIHQLGDGIQSIIILTFPLFANVDKSMLIGIEEPEVYLHPGMQRKLMEVLLDKDGKYGFENFQYLITTHSNHFLDLTLDYPQDVIVYESKKLDDSKFEITRKNDDNMLELMDNLGVRNSSVFLANSTIWVEGITDRLYLKKYMEVYQREMLAQGKINKIYEEDKHYSFIEYSGGNITHWDFLDEEDGMSSGKISNNIFLIADTDGEIGTGSKKDERIKTLKEKLEENFYALEAKEIENLLTPKVIKKVVLTKEKNNTKIDVDKLEAVEFIQDEYQNKGIGSYIAETLKVGEITGHRKYKADSGIIHEKVKFCRIACNNIISMDFLSKEALLICEKLYNFIAKANGNEDLKVEKELEEDIA